MMTKLFYYPQIKKHLLVLWACLLSGLGSVCYAQDDRNREGGVNDPFVDSNGPGGVGQGRYLPPGQRPPTNFRLGIYSRNTDTGVLVTSVNAGSVAQQSGIEAQDIIIAVNGYQVGIINGRTYDIAEELARRVDAQGRVMLLVRNHGEYPRSVLWQRPRLGGFGLRQCKHCQSTTSSTRHDAHGACYRHDLSPMAECLAR